jgi:hypothetical protein
MSTSQSPDNPTASLKEQLGPIETPNWPAVLESAREISVYIDTHSPQDVDTEFIEEHFHGAGAILRQRDIASLSAGPEDSNIADPDKEVRYAAMTLETMPPIVIEENVVRDGNHRFREAVRQGAKTILCYDVCDENEIKEAKKLVIDGSVAKKTHKLGT